MLFQDTREPMKPLKFGIILHKIEEPRTPLTKRKDLETSS
jgi:hypothetical protein